jgi:hypothetical protein
VLLTLDPVWLQSSSSSNMEQQQHDALLSGSNSSKAEKQQQQQQVLIPRTSARLAGMSLPGFLSMLGSFWGAGDHQAALWQQQVRDTEIKMRTQPCRSSCSFLQDCTLQA